MFKPGDMVERINFSNHGTMLVGSRWIVESIIEGSGYNKPVWMKVKGFIPCTRIENFKLVTMKVEKSMTYPCVKVVPAVVTLVPGKLTDDFDIEQVFEDKSVIMRANKKWSNQHTSFSVTADSLREAAKAFNYVADVLEGKVKV